MNIGVIGTGYVGLVTGACLASLGHTVFCIDVDEDKIRKLNSGIIPIYEPGLDEIVTNCRREHKLFFLSSLVDCINKCDALFCAVGTPQSEDGSADLTYVFNVAKEFGKLIDKPNMFITKSTVPVGTGDKVKNIISEELQKRNVNIEFHVGSNPEFLKEGCAIDDFMSPDRIVVGVEDVYGKLTFEKIYASFLNATKFIVTDIKSAEMIKYTSNAMLATRISFMNDIWNLCELVGADVMKVMEGIGSDTRIGNKFLMPGCGYGGSCFPKDVKALIHTAQENGYEMKVLKAVEEVNANQKEKLFNQVYKHFNGELNGKIIGIWGLAFKPNTDDMREATSLTLIDKFVEAGALVKVYDPIAMDECRRRVGSKVVYCEDKENVAFCSDALCLVTEWDEFKNVDYKKIKHLMNNNSIIVDGRFIIK